MLLHACAKEVRRAALECAAATKKEAQAAVLGCDANPARARDALAHAEQEHAAAGDPDADDLPSNEDALFSDLDFQVSDHCNLHQALLL